MNTLGHMIGRKRKGKVREFHEALPVVTTVPRGGIYSQQNELGLEESGEGRQQDPEGGETPLQETREVQEETSTAHSLSIPSVFLPSYNKAACLLLSSTNIVEAPGDHKGFLVASDTGATPYFVAVKKNGVCICQCKGFKTASLCSYSLAVADHVAKLHEYLSWCHSRGGPNTTAAASTSAPKNAHPRKAWRTQEKPGQKSRIRGTGAIAS